MASWRRILRRDTDRSEPSGPPAPPPLRRPTALRCADLDVYLACVLDRAVVQERVGGRCYPVLGGGAGVEPAPIDALPSLELTRGRDAAELVDLCEQRLRGADVGPARVLVVGADEYALLGAAFALATGRRLVRLREGLHELTGRPDLRSDGSLLVLLPPWRLAARSLPEMLEAAAPALADGGSGAPGLGLLTGATPAVLSATLARLAARGAPGAPSGRYYHYAPTSLPLDASADLEILDGRADPTLLLRETTDAAAPFVIVQGHGHHYCFSRGFLCSSRGSGDPRECVGGMTCVHGHGDLSRESIRAFDLRSDVVLLDSCSSGNFQRQPEPGSNVALALLEGEVCSVVTPASLSSPMPLTPYLCWERLVRGSPLGEVVSVLNAHVLDSRRVPHNYVLFGDPELRPFEAGDASVTEATARSLHEGTWRVDVAAGPGVRALLVREPALAEHAARRALYVDLPAGEGNAMAAQVVGVRGGALELLVVCERWKDGPPPYVLLTTSPPYDEEVFEDALLLRERARRDALEPDEPGSCFAEPGDEGFAEDPVAALDALLAGFETVVASYRGHSPFLSGQYEEFAAAGTEARSWLVLAGQALLERFVSVTNTLSQPCTHFAGTRGVQAERVQWRPSACAACGGTVRIEEYRVGLRPEYRRTWSICEACRGTRDWEPGFADFALELPAALRPGTAATARVRVENPLPRRLPIHVAVAPRPRDGAGPPIEIQPARLWRTVEPGAALDESLELLAPESMIPHQHEVRAFVSWNGVLGFASGMVEVGESANDMPA